MADDYRLTIDFDDEGDGMQFAEWLAALDLDAAEREQVGDRVVVSRDGPRVFLYTDSEERGRAVQETVSARIASEGQSAAIALECWHPVEQAWKDVSIPLPQTDDELRGEHERLQEREAAESRERGEAEWEVRVELPTHEDTVSLAERLKAEGIPVIRRYTFLLAGAANEDDAHALAERLEREVPQGAAIEVEASGSVVWEIAPRNPFVLFGGLGA
jgi:hypothetical protein